MERESVQKCTYSGYKLGYDGLFIFWSLSILGGDDDISERLRTLSQQKRRLLALGPAVARSRLL